MCGIAGLAGRPLVMLGAQPYSDTLRMIGEISHRGPDSVGVVRCSGEPVFLGTATLSILSATTRGPYLDQDHPVAVTYNGEIYNYLDVGSRLGIPLGPHDTDATVVLQGYLKRGMGIVDLLDGMFAFAIYDARSRRLILCRDRLGEKSLYYQIRDGVLSFASEVKALLTSSPATPELDAGWLAFESPIMLRTAHSGITAVEPGTWLAFDVDTAEVVVVRYWDIAATPSAPELSYDDAVEQCTDLVMAAAVSRRPDEPFGLLLSGGIDSALLAFAMQPDWVFTVGYPDMARFDEVGPARAIADAVGARHVVLTPTAAEFRSVLPAIMHHLDYPIGNASMFSEYIAYRAVADKGLRICVAGLGPDEFLMGYVRQALLLLGADIVEPQVSPAYQPLVALYRERITPDMDAATRYRELIRRGPMVSSWPAEFVDRTFARGTDLAKSMSLVEMQLTLPSLLATSDKLSSAFGLERRSPYLDTRLVEFMYSQPVSYKVGTPMVTKRLLRDVAARLRVPSQVWANPDKLGFASPVNAWLRGELAGWAERKITQVDPAGILTRTLGACGAARQEFDRSRMALLVLALWHEQRGQDPLDVSELGVA